jgi:biopolymer transport protein TolR
MTFGNGYPSGQLQGEINVTPLIDVLLVVLIIFMVIVPALPRGLNAALPQQSSNSARNLETPIVVQILSSRDGAVSYKINQSEVAINDLGDRLSALLSIRAEKVFGIRGDNDLDFSTVARVMDIGKGAGADHIGLMTRSDTGWN